MPKKSPKSVVVINFSRATGVFFGAGILGLSSISLGVSGLSTAKVEIVSPHASDAAVENIESLSVAPSPAGQKKYSEREPRGGGQVRGTAWTATIDQDTAPSVDIPINQSLVKNSPRRQALLPHPIAVPVETEWVAGFNMNFLSSEKIEEILRKASGMKDTLAFAPGSGANSNERMREWLASDRTVVAGTPRAFAVLQLVNYGWGLDQWPYLDRMWWHESGWDPQTVDEQQGNGYGQLDPSKTWGIPQANPASKMASAGDDWATNPETQIRWGLGYIQKIYGTPANAWAKWRERAATGRYGWY